MAVQDEDSFKRYVANGVATVYAIPFLLLSASDLQVTLDAVPVTSGFTVSGVGSNTGSITFDAAPTGDLLLQRVVPFERLTDYQDNGDLLAQTVNRDFDRLWLAMQELRRDDSTALRTSPLEPEGIPNLPLAAQRASRVLAFGPTGDPVVSSLTIDELEQQPALAIASAEAAAAAAGASAASASAASGSAAAAAAAEEKAQKWAEEAEDVEVEPGKFSAFHWAEKAEQNVAGLDARVTDLEAKGIKSATAQSTASGTAVDFTGIPPGVRRVVVVLRGVSTTGSSALAIQLGSGSVQATGYASVGNSVASVVGTLTSTSRLVIGSGSGANSAHSGLFELVNISGNTWVFDGGASDINNSCQRLGSGDVTLSGILDRVRLTTVNGTDTFDAGTVNIIYES